MFRAGGCFRPGAAHVILLTLLLAFASPPSLAIDLTDEDNQQAILIGALGSVNLQATAVGIAGPPLVSLIAEYTALAANNALKAVPAPMNVPPDRSFLPNTPDQCGYRFPLPQSAAKYSNVFFFDLDPLPEDWGALGRPEIAHNNTEVYVYPKSRYISEGLLTQQTVEFPLGINLVTWQADTMWDPVFDLAIPTAFALFNTKKLEASKHAAAVAKQAAKARAGQKAFKRALQWLAEKGGLAIKKCVGKVCPLIFIDSATQTEQVSVTKLRQQGFTVLDVIDPTLLVSQPVVTLEATDPGGTRLDRVAGLLRDTIDVSDTCDRPVTLFNNLPDLLPIGETIATWTARDPGPNQAGERNSVTRIQRIRVADTQGPILVPPAGRVLEVNPAVSTGLARAEVQLGGPRVVDLADLDPLVASDAPEFFPVGSRTAVTWRATDASGNSTEANQLITVKAEGTNTAPTVTDLSAHTLTSEPIDLLLRGSDPDELDGRFDPLAFRVVDRPENGEFLAPLLPYFIEDFRSAVQGPYVERGAPAQTSDLRGWFIDNICSKTLLGEREEIRRDWPYQPKFIHVNDDGSYLLIDSYWRCTSSSATTLDERISKWSRDNEYLGQTTYSGSTEAFAVDQDGFLYVITNIGGGSSASMTLAQIHPDFGDGEAFEANPRRDSWRLDQSSARDPERGIDDPIVPDGLSYARVDSQRGLLYVNDRRRVMVFDIRQDLADPEANSVNTFGTGSTDGMNRRYLGTLADGAELLCGGGTGSSRGGFGIEVDGDGNLYVADSCDDRIHRFEPSDFDAEGNFVMGAYVGWLGGCTASTNNACDLDKQRSRGYSCTDATCTLLNDASGPGQFDTPVYLDLDPNNILYVADRQRVQRFAPDGTFAGEAKSTGTGINQGERPGFVLGNLGDVKAVTVNATNFFVVDQAESFIHVFETTPLKDITDSSATVTYVSDFSFHSGSDSFTYTATDGLATSNVGTVTVQVNRNFRPPEAFAQEVALDEDTAVALTLTGDDPDGVIGTDDVFPLDRLTFEIVSQPQFGVLEGSGTDWTYTPAPNYTGPDAFTFVANDGREDSPPATVAIDVQPVNDRPRITAVDVPERIAAGFPTVVRWEYEDDGEYIGSDGQPSNWGAYMFWGDSPVASAGAGEDVFTDPDGDGPEPPRLAPRKLQISAPIGGKSSRTATEFGIGSVFGEHVYTAIGATFDLDFGIGDGSRPLANEQGDPADTFRRVTRTVQHLVNLGVSLETDEPETNADFIDLMLKVTNLQPEAGVPGRLAKNVTVWQVPDTDVDVELRLRGDDCSTVGNGEVACSVSSLPAGSGFSELLRVRPAGNGMVIYDLEVPVAFDVATTTASLKDSYTALQWITFRADTTDTDGDGMSDVFETTYGLNATSGDDRAGDLDGDGLTNLEEFAARTDPTSADTDGDSIADADDSCPLDPSGSADFDADGLCEAVRDLSPVERSRMLKFIQLLEALNDR